MLGRVTKSELWELVKQDMLQVDILQLQSVKGTTVTQ